MEQIEVVPNKDGTWNWRKRANDKISGRGGGYDTRREAIEAAREQAGVEPLFNGAGERVSQSEPHTSVVLLRKDGSVHGELYAPRSGAQAQRVDLTPAGESGKAGLK